MEVDAEYFLFRSIVQHANDLITVFDELGRIVFMNEASCTLLGAPPAHFVGLSVVDFVHPDERERAILTLQVGREFGAAPGTTHFRIRRSDGSYLPLELTTGRASDGTREYLTVVGRPSETREGLERAMMQLVDGSSMTDIMITVCDTVSWRQLKSRVGIVWQTSDGTTQRVTQGGTLPDVLCGIGAGTDSLFALAQARDERVQSADLSRLPDDLRRLAESLHMGGFWIEPVRVGSESALIVVWTVAGGHPPTVHVQGMQLGAASSKSFCAGRRNNNGSIARRITTNLRSCPTVRHSSERSNAARMAPFSIVISTTSNRSTITTAMRRATTYYARLRSVYAAAFARPILSRALVAMSSRSSVRTAPPPKPKDSSRAFTLRSRSPSS